MKSPQIIAVCHVVASINEHTGGPAVSVPAICDAVVSHGVDPILFCLDLPNAGRQLLPDRVSVVSVEVDPASVRLGGISIEARLALLETARDARIIHNHGMWMAPNVYSRRAAKTLSIPLVISPRGMLEEWSMRRSRLKKRLAWMLYEKSNLLSARAFHATSEEEFESIRKRGFTQPVAVIPNGINIEKIKPGREELESRFPALASKNWILFMSRLHPKKGLDILFECWREIEASHPGWQLIVAGAESPGYEGKFQRLASELGIAERITFTGNLSGREKAAALARSEFMVLPTHSENFGIVVAESLAHEIPVITTHGTPWRELNEQACGWWIPLDRETLKETITNAIAIGPGKRRDMGHRGRRLVASRYTWDSAGRRMAEFYRWIIEGGTPPECVRL